jgi:hypothetical protein
MMMRAFWKWILLWMTALLGGGLTLGAAAAPQVTVGEVQNPGAEYRFGEQLHIGAQISSPISVDAVWVSLQNVGEEAIYKGQAELSELGEASYTQDLSRQPLRAFGLVDYWFTVHLQDGSEFVSERFTFRYEDNRHEWQSISQPPFVVHWYNQDPDLGARVVEAAQQGLAQAQTTFSAPPPPQVDIYVYDTALEMQSTLRLAGVHWAAGHADPDLGIMVVALPAGPEQRLLIRQRIPHELMHIMLYQAMGRRYSAYRSVPAWLNEGLSSMAEVPNPDYQVILSKAAEKQSVISFAELCNGFPADASRAFLAYAQADSFVRYLYSQYGANTVQSLLAAYANQMDCERAVEVTYGKSLVQLEREWQQVRLGMNTARSALEKLLPWLLLLLVTLTGPAIVSFTAGAQRRSAGKRTDGE